MQTVNSGWRRPARIAQPSTPPPEVGLKELFAASRLAVTALSLRSSQRFVLDQLVGCFRGELIHGRYLVWPSNEFLMERTGLSERAVRYAIRGLIAEGVITSKESANGKRFAVRSKSGQISDAYGLDLSPLLQRQAEYSERCEEIKVAREYRRRQFDEITICRRSTQEMLSVLSQVTDKEPIDDLLKEFDRQVEILPRRDSLASPEAALASWRVLLEVTQSRYDAAFGGNNSRIIKDNNENPDQSCYKGFEDIKQNRTEPTMIEIADACPDALQYVTNVRTERDLINEAGRLRGVFGTHESAWHEAIELLGPARAAKAFFVVLQRYSDDAGQTIKNFGGYFRAYVRMIDTGRVDLIEEVRGMRRRRAN